MPHWRGLLLAISLTLLVPAAAACTLSPNVEGAKYEVVDAHTDETWEFRLEDWGLSASCDILVPHDLDDSTFAWANASAVHVRDLEAGARDRVAVESPHALSLVGEVLVVGPHTSSSVLRIDLSTGNRTEVDLGRNLTQGFVLNEGVFLWPEEGSGGGNELYAFDAVEGRWLLEGRPASDIGVDPRAAPVMAGPLWMGFEDGSIYDVRNDTSYQRQGIVENASDPGWSMSHRGIPLDGSSVWDVSDGELRTARLPDGNWTRVATVEDHPTALTEGFVLHEEFVTGDGDDGEDTDTGGDGHDQEDPGDRLIPGPGAVLGVAALVAGSIGRRLGGG